MNNQEVILNQENLTKAKLELDCQNIQSRVAEGQLNALEVYIKAKYLSKLSEQLLQNIRVETFNEIDKYNIKEDRTLLGCKFTTRAGYIKYDYMKDPIYAELSQQLKNREELLKTAIKLKKLNQVCIDNDSGEIVEAVPVKTIIEDSIIITFK